MATGTRVESEIRAGDISVQLVSHLWPTPVDTVFGEAQSEHVIALQCQPPQARSDGRFRGAESERFGEIGRVLAMPAGSELHVRASGGTVRAIRCAFSAEAFQRCGDEDKLLSPPSFHAILDIRKRRIADTMRRLGEEVRQPGFAGDLLVELLGATLMIDLARHLGGLTRPARGGLAHFQIEQIRARVEDGPGPPTLVELAQIIGVSRRHLSRAFREATGRTIHQYVEESRFRKATEMLRDTDLLLKDIAFRLGFEHACSFSTAFRKMTGETPKAYRNRILDGAVSMPEPSLRSAAAEFACASATHADSRYTV
jgi:AraC family transcriptional regulator